MLEDTVALRDLCGSFQSGLRDLEYGDGEDAIAIEATLAPRVVALARALGWRGGPAFHLRPIDYPRAGAFPRFLHQHTGRFRAGASGPELWLNANALHSGSFALLVERLPLFLWVLGAMLERRPDICADLPLFPGDACFWSAVSSSSNHPDACLIPDPDYFRTAGYAEFRRAMDAQMPPWTSRRTFVHWRGSTSGIKRYWPPRAPDDTRWLARLELCDHARSSALAPYLDIGFMNLVQVPPADAAALETALAPLRRPPVAKTEAAGFKAVIDIDGNSNTWSSGLYCSLLSGACVIKVASEHGFRQWYYDRLVPWEHYVPVRADLSDLDERVRLVLRDDELARTIGLAGRKLALSMDFATELSTTADRLIAWATETGAGAAAALFPYST